MRGVVLYYMDWEIKGYTFRMETKKGRKRGNNMTCEANERKYLENFVCGLLSLK